MFSKAEKLKNKVPMVLVYGVMNVCQHGFAIFVWHGIDPLMYVIYS